MDNKLQYLQRIKCRSSKDCNENQGCMKTPNDSYNNKLCVIRKCRRIEDCLDVGHPWGYGRYAPIECEKSYYGELGRCIYEKSPQNSICWWKTNRMLKYTMQRFTSELKYVIVSQSNDNC